MALSISDKLVHKWTRFAKSYRLVDMIQDDFNGVVQYSGNIQQLIQLYRRGASINAPQQLDRVINGNNVETVKFLIENGWNVSYDYYKVIALIAKKNDVNTLRVMNSTRGFDSYDVIFTLNELVDIKNEIQEAITYLLSLNVIESYHQYHVGLVFESAISNDNFALVQYLIKSQKYLPTVTPAYVKSIKMFDILQLYTDHDDIYYSHVLCNSMNTNNELADHILSKNVSKSILNSTLVLMCGNGITKVDAIERIIISGANIKCNFNAPFVAACKNRNYVVAEYLLLNGVNINEPNGQPLLDALKDRDITMVQWLETNGVDKDHEVFYLYLYDIIARDDIRSFKWIVRNIKPLSSNIMKLCIQNLSSECFEYILKKHKPKQSELNKMLILCCYHHYNLRIIELLIEYGAGVTVIQRNRMRSDVYQNMLNVRSRYVNRAIIGIECIIDSEPIGRGDLYISCTSNVKHYIRAKYYRKLKQKICCYCRQPLNEQIYRNK
jgi:hypothetical protein